MNDLISRRAALDAWKKDFKEFVNTLDISRDDYRGIMEYIDEFPTEPESSKNVDFSTSVGDLISRQDAIDAIYEHEFSNWCDKDEVSTILNDLPPAEPERGTGKKIVLSTGMMGYWACDQCRKPVGAYDDFCPKCGVKFIEEGEPEKGEDDV